jgi:hypothetical protein
MYDEKLPSSTKVLIFAVLMDHSSSIAHGIAWRAFTQFFAFVVMDRKIQRFDCGELPEQ